MNNQFWTYYNGLPEDPDNFITQFWKDRIEEIKESFTPVMPTDFLQNRMIRYTMFVDFCEYNKIEYEHLKENIDPDSLALLLSESLVGQPSTCMVDKIQTSGNTIHHLYHMQRYLDAIGENDFKTIVEWGGGYGNMARLFRCMDDTLTYIIIDTKIFSIIQYIYLSQALYEDDVNLGSIKKGKVNIIPLGMLDSTRFKADLFISTWAISESSRTAQDYVIDRKAFGAERFLIAHQCAGKDFPEADNVKRLVDNGRECYHEEIDFIKSNWYLFK